MATILAEGQCPTSSQDPHFHGRPEFWRTTLRYRSFDGIATKPKLFDEATKRQPSIRLVLPRELGNAENVGKNLFARRTERESEVRPRFSQSISSFSVTGR